MLEKFLSVVVDQRRARRGVSRRRCCCWRADCWERQIDRGTRSRHGMHHRRARGKGEEEASSNPRESINMRLRTLRPGAFSLLSCSLPLMTIRYGKAMSHGAMVDTVTYQLRPSMAIRENSSAGYYARHTGFFIFWCFCNCNSCVF